jgi:hypothetical protein
MIEMGLRDEAVYQYEGVLRVVVVKETLWGDERVKSLSPIILR